MKMNSEELIELAYRKLILDKGPVETKSGIKFPRGLGLMDFSIILEVEGESLLGGRFRIVNELITIREREEQKCLQ